MPLDGHSYLVSQGWGGKGKALRDGAIDRPLIVAQKKNLSGVGKDRDEAFPFWDHVFSAAASSIKVKIHGDNDDDDTQESSGSNTPQLDRTITGIISNRPQKLGTPVLSGTSTPDINPGPSIMALAKREAARRGLYAMFFRGPVLGPDLDEEVVQELATKAEIIPTTSGEGKERKRKSNAEKEAAREEKRLRREARQVKRERKALKAEGEIKRKKAKELKTSEQRKEDLADLPGAGPLLSAIDEGEAPKKTKKRTREGELKQEDDVAKKKKRKKSRDTT